VKQTRRFGALDYSKAAGDMSRPNRAVYFQIKINLGLPTYPLRSRFLHKVET
jgi:hypothetical protein